MDAALRLGKVHIIEWLRPGDRRTGRELFDELEPMGIVSQPNVLVGFRSVSTRLEFIALLREIEQDFRRTRRVPFLHIETHGNDDGIGISQAEGLTFFELMTELIPLNQLTGLRLVVILAACEGIWGVKMLQPTERAAFLALIGPNRRMSPDELARGMQSFYRSIFRDRNGNAAIRAMNDAVDPTKTTFGVFNAEGTFKMVYEEFLNRLGSEEAIARRAAAINAKLGARIKQERGVARWSREIAATDAFLRRQLSDHDRWFEHYRRRYFFIDLYPENDERFPITIKDSRSDCIGETG
jgi:hypothetical protein